ncbi:MAG: hypothetical protein V4684_08205 [Pseudomonadota bacterium]
MSAEVSIDAYSDAHIAPMFELFASHFSPDDRLLTTAYTNWLYVLNPFGRALMVKVTDGDRWIGFMAMVPAELKSRFGRRRAYYAVNALVHPKHQGKNIFGRMIAAARDRTVAEDAALLGHPNQIAVKTWQRARAHFHEALRPSLALPAFGRRGLCATEVNSIEDLKRAGAFLDEITAQSESWRLAVTAEYLDWRYLRHPSSNYRIQLLDLGGAPMGVQMTKRVRPGLHLLIDQFVQADQVLAATRQLPWLTLCFLPESVTLECAGAVWPLPWKKRIPFFLTYGVEASDAKSFARMGLSASDF